MSAGRVVEIHLQAPPKPPVGAACNGCGLCCLAEPCPLGMLLSRARHGPCRALAWDGAEGRYRCGAIRDPRHHLPWLPAALARRLALRWVAAGAGCDAEIEPADVRDHERDDGRDRGRLDERVEDQA